ncbi:unnamed protein product [Ectocarpus sp. 6 AP-2014]
MAIITEGNVCMHILSFSSNDYIFTGTVCKSWYTNSSTKNTNILTTLESTCRVQEAIASHMDCYQLLDVAIVFGADMDVVLRIAETVHCCDTDIVRLYAAFTGNALAMSFVEGYYDECCLFEALRGGQRGVVQAMLRGGIYEYVNNIPQWTSDEQQFLDRCKSIAESNNRLDVVQSLDLYIHDDYFHADMSCMELAIHRSRLDLLHLLNAGGADFPENAFALAVHNGGLDMLRYLKSEDIKPGDDFVMNYMSGVDFDANKLQLLLQNNLVQLGYRDLHVAIHRRSTRTTNRLIQFGCPVNDATVDNAVAAWDFAIADRLMVSHMCRPTNLAYLWLFTGGLCSCCVHGLYPAANDEFYVGKLNWIYSATRFEIGFNSFSEMEADANWSIMLPRVSRNIVRWFKDHFNNKKQRRA